MLKPHRHQLRMIAIQRRVQRADGVRWLQQTVQAGQESRLYCLLMLYDHALKSHVEHPQLTESGADGAKQFIFHRRPAVLVDFHPYAYKYRCTFFLF